MVQFYIIGLLMLIHKESVYCEAPLATVTRATSDTTATSVTRATSDTTAASDTEYIPRLTYGKYGMVEIKVRNTWGFVCPNHFTDADAMVLCRQLSYKGGFAYLLIRKYDNGLLPLVFRLGCQGTEQSIQECNNFIGGNVSECDSDSFAAAHCYNETGYEFRLVNESTPAYGLVEMAIDGEWRPFCGYDGFDLNWRAIDYICRKLGYSAGSLVSRSQRNPVEKVWVTRISYCDGYPSIFFHCPLVLYSHEEPYDPRSWANNRYRGLINERCTTGLLPTIKCF